MNRLSGMKYLQCGAEPGSSAPRGRRPGGRRAELPDLCEHLAQVLDGATDVDRDRLRGDAERLRDLVIAGLALPAEQEHLTLPARQRVNRPLDRRRDLVGGELLVGIRRQGRRPFQHHGIGVLPLPPLLDPTPPQVVQGLIACDGVEIAARGGPGEIDLVPLLPDPEKRLVHQVLSRFGRLDVAIDEPVKLGEVPIEELPEGRRGTSVRPVVGRVEISAVFWLAITYAVSPVVRREPTMSGICHGRR